MSVPTTSWDETTPAGSSNINLGDNRIRELKTQIREVVGVDHDFPSSGQDAGNGQHLQVTLQEQADLGTGAVNATILGSQTINGKGELVYVDEDNNKIQLTQAGNMGSNGTNLNSNNVGISGTLNVIGAADFDGALTANDLGIDQNDTWITAKDAAGTGTVNLIKADSNDVPVIPDGTETATNSAPSSDKDVSNKKYVDDQVATASISDIEDYGSSASSSTSKSESALKIAYGTTGSISGDGTVTITNLPFTSSTSFKVTATNDDDVTSNLLPASIGYDSGAQITITNMDPASQSFSWIAIGT